ncbi:unnamed protein product [Choristocarpus tenellus]
MASSLGASCRPMYDVEDENVNPPLHVCLAGSDIPLSCLDLKYVFLNDKAVLTEIELCGRRGYPQRVELTWEQGWGQSTVDASVQFQLENENLKGLRELTAGGMAVGEGVSADLSVAADPASYPPGYNFNELLNQAGVVEECVVPAMGLGRRPLVVVFNPTLVVSMVLLM